MATWETRRLQVQDPDAMKELREAFQGTGKDYELAMGGCISKRRIPLLQWIEAEAGAPVVGTSMDGTRGRQSAQCGAIFQWHRGHRQGQTRRPEGTIEFLGPGGIIYRVDVIEISLQSDFPGYGDNVPHDMSRHKASQIANTTHVLARKPSYESAAIIYWYLCPSAPSQRTQDELLIPLQNMRGTERVTIIWVIVEHG
jgi:hypothetical protein